MCNIFLKKCVLKSFHCTINSIKQSYKELFKDKLLGKFQSRKKHQKIQNYLKNKKLIQLNPFYTFFLKNVVFCCFEIGILDLRGNFIPVCEDSPWDFKEGSHWVEFRKGRVPISQLDGGYAQRPDVAAGVVGGVQLLLACNDLQGQTSAFTHTCTKNPAQQAAVCRLSSQTRATSQTQPPRRDKPGCDCCPEGNMLTNQLCDDGRRKSCTSFTAPGLQVPKRGKLSRQHPETLTRENEPFPRRRQYNYNFTYNQAAYS